MDLSLRFLDNYFIDQFWYRGDFEAYSYNHDDYNFEYYVGSLIQDQNLICPRIYVPKWDAFHEI